MTMYDGICWTCGKEYEKERDSNKPAPKYCSKDCYYKRAEDYSDNYRYKGKTVEHRQIMAQILGRKLLDTEIVHHIDHNKRNNDPSNLQLFSSNGEHIRFHNTSRNYSTRYIPAIEVECATCDSVFVLSTYQRKMYKKGQEKFFCSRECTDKNNSHGDAPIIPCDICGVLISIPFAWFKRNKHHYCGRDCASDAKSLERNSDPELFNQMKLVRENKL